MLLNFTAVAAAAQRKTTMWWERKKSGDKFPSEFNIWRTFKCFLAESSISSHKEAKTFDKLNSLDIHENNRRIYIHSPRSVEHELWGRWRSNSVPSKYRVNFILYLLLWQSRKSPWCLPIRMLDSRVKSSWRRQGEIIRSSKARMRSFSTEKLPKAALGLP